MAKEKETPLAVLQKRYADQLKQVERGDESGLHGVTRDLSIAVIQLLTGELVDSGELKDRIQTIPGYHNLICQILGVAPEAVQGIVDGGAPGQTGPGES